MKKLLILLLMCVALAGCDPTIYPQAHESAVAVCENNGGYTSYEYSTSLSMTSETMKVNCADGAKYQLKFETIMTPYTGNDGSTYERWENNSDHKWVVVK